MSGRAPTHGPLSTMNYVSGKGLFIILGLCYATKASKPSWCPSASGSRRLLLCQSLVNEPHISEAAQGSAPESGCLAEWAAKRRGGRPAGRGELGSRAAP